MTNASPAPHTVLVVDDEALLRLYAVDILTDAGCSTIEAGNADEALVCLDQSPAISILFTDVHMPGSLNGLDLAHRVHHLRPDMHIVIVSGRLTLCAEDMPPRGKFIAKPYHPSTVTSLINSVAR